MRKMPKMSKFPVTVPVELHRAFKVKCASEGVLMFEVVRGWLERVSRLARQGRAPLRGADQCDAPLGCRARAGDHR